MKIIMHNGKRIARRREGETCENKKSLVSRDLCLVSLCEYFLQYCPGHLSPDGWAFIDCANIKRLIKMKQSKLMVQEVIENG